MATTDRIPLNRINHLAAAFHRQSVTLGKYRQQEAASNAGRGYGGSSGFFPSPALS